MDYMAAQMDRQIEGAQHRYDEALNEGEQPAFPVQASEYGGHGTCFGLTIRDYFAAHAPCAPDDFDWAAGETDLVQRMTRWRYAYADSMLAARVKP